jgi:purine-binding chemotaxis protein CheW
MMNEQLPEVSRGGKYLTFQLGSEDYGIGIFSVTEIIGMVPVTAVPQAPIFMKGVVNLRGKVIPVIDLRLKFQMKAMGYTERTCIIVVEHTSDKGIVSRAGVVVDAVSEVIHINDNSIEDAPEFSQQVKGQAILGMAKLESGLKILLDINKALQEMSSEKIQMAA